MTFEAAPECCEVLWPRRGLAAAPAARGLPCDRVPRACPLVVSARSSWSPRMSSTGPSADRGSAATSCSRIRGSGKIHRALHRLVAHQNGRGYVAAALVRWGDAR